MKYGFNILFESSCRILLFFIIVFNRWLKLWVYFSFLFCNQTTDKDLDNSIAFKIRNARYWSNIEKSNTSSASSDADVIWKGQIMHVFMNHIKYSLTEILLQLICMIQCSWKWYSSVWIYPWKSNSSDPFGMCVSLALPAPFVSV